MVKRLEVVVREGLHPELIARARRLIRILCVIRKADVRLPEKGNSNSHGARPVHLFITMIKLIRTSKVEAHPELVTRPRRLVRILYGESASSSPQPKRAFSSTQPITPDERTARGSGDEHLGFEV